MHWVLDDIQHLWKVTSLFLIHSNESVLADTSKSTEVLTCIDPMSLFGSFVVSVVGIDFLSAHTQTYKGAMKSKPR